MLQRLSVLTLIFFLYLPFNAVHAPLQASEKYLGRFAGIKDPKPTGM